MSSNHIKRAGTISAAVVFYLLVAISVAAQQPWAPARGFEAAGSYAPSDFETISTTNGNLMLHFPFSLPAGRGGSAAQIGLYYDSKYLDSYLQDYLQQGFLWIKRQNLGRSDAGGWHYGLGYSLQVIDRLQNRDPDQPIQCGDEHHWQVRLRFPDGSVHELIPNGWNSHNGGDGYYDILPGQHATCYCATADSNGCTMYGVVSGSASTGTIPYYSFDGTYVRVDWQPGGSWTLYLPDGTRVVQSAGSSQRIYGRNGNDANGNYVTLDYITYNGHPAVRLLDPLNRSVILEYGSAPYQDTIHTVGVGGAPLDYQIKWNGIEVSKTYQPEYPSGGAVGDLTTLSEDFGMVSEIDLPQESGGLKYVFGYNAPYEPGTPTSSSGWGELNFIDLPSHAQVQYHYALDGQSGMITSDVLKNTVSQKILTYQQEYDGNSTPVTETTNYTITDNVTGQSTIVNPDGGTTSDYHDSAKRTYKTIEADGTIVERIWLPNRPQGHPGMYSLDQYMMNIYDAQRVNPYVKTEFTSIKDANGNLSKTSIKDYTYDKNNNLTSTTEYDWVDYATVQRSNGFPTGAIPAGAVVKRVITNTYWQNTPDASDSTSTSSNAYSVFGSPNLRTAVATSEVSDGSQILSRSEFFYDDPATTGNLTQQKSWDSTKGAYSNPLTSSNSISVSHQYDGYGNPTLNTDARNNQTQFVYGSVGGFADLYPTQIKTAFQTTVQRTEAREYDFSTGLVTRVTDVDNNVSASTIFDVFGRPTLVKAAEGKPEETRTSTEYSDVNRRIIVRSDLNTLGDGKLVSIQHYDQLGRVRLARQLEDAATQSATDETQGIKVQKRYLFSGSNSYALTSNAYRANYSSNAGSEVTMGWTRSKSDNGGRLIEVQTFGGSGLPDPWGPNTTTTGTVTTAYDANFTTVTDQTSRMRRSQADALGKLIRVDEPDKDSGQLGATTDPIQPTCYEYDVLGNLTKVIQGTQLDPATSRCALSGSQQRTFTYDSLSRLRSAVNPESGTVNYSYDNNGNLTSKTDARSITTDYVYDSLNRVTSRGYQNDPNSTPSVTYAYDYAPDVTNAKGRLVSVSSSVSSYSYSGYDPMGKVLGGRQTIGAQTYSMNYSYDLAGHVKTMTYPSGRTVTDNYDNAGRLQNLSGNLGDGGASRNYSTGISYSALGGMSQEQLGTTIPIYNKRFYNSRGQLSEIREGLAPNDTSWQRGAIINFYDTCWGICNYNGVSQPMPNNNGNLKIQQVSIPHTDAADYEQQPRDEFTQYFEYDSLNRLRFANEASWKQQYAYDRYGNRTIDQANTYGAGIPKPNFTVTSNNRLGVPSGYGGTMHYDAAGNLDVDTYSAAAVTRLYDAENRMTKETQTNNYDAGIYSYDGDGRRVKRNVGGVETWQVYGVGGELIAEYSATNSNPLTPQKEYGYRNGQLLITATVTSGSGWGAPPTFTPPDPLSNGDAIKLENLTELRTAVNQLREHAGLPDYAFTVDPNPVRNETTVKADHIRQLRAALEEARSHLGLSTSYANPTPTPYTSLIFAIDFQELRNQIRSAWNSGSGGGVDIRWLVSDQLGTPRMIFDQNGSLANTSRHDYLPFGEELTTQGGRTPQLGYVGDNMRQKFTGYENDAETGLNFAQARYQSPTQGRFTSPDPYVIFFEMKRGRDAEEEEEMFLEYLMEPQNWAKYNYGLNNPLIHTDPSGMRPPTHNEQLALNELDQLAKQEGDSELGRGLRAARDEISKAIDRLGRGQQSVGINVAVNAILNIGNQRFANASVTIISKSGHTVRIGADQNKCNIFVASTNAEGAGIGFSPDNGHQNGRGFPIEYNKKLHLWLPLTANELGASGRQITNLSVVSGSPQIGDTIAWRNNDPSSSGHSSVYIGGNVLVYAGSGSGVPKAQTLSYVDNNMSGHESHVVRRYNGKP